MAPPLPIRPGSTMTRTCPWTLAYPRATSSVRSATVSAISRWRQRHEHGLLIVDQFEELFTQNPPEVQARFSELLGRLVLEADVFVLLSMRDDFFFHCHEHEALTPVVADLTLENRLLKKSMIGDGDDHA